MSQQTQHISVLRGEVLDALRASEGGDFLDCTLGGAGHTAAILDANAHNTVFAIDRDQRAIDRAALTLSKFGERVAFAKSTFSKLEDAVEGRSFNGVLADLGISTDQIKEQRGFSFRDESALDMRMDESQDVSAQFVVNEYPEHELFKVLKRGGVGPEARAVAKAIVAARPIKTTGALASVIDAAIFASNKKKGVHPATVVFQAIRVEVNREFEEIESLLETLPKITKPGARAVIISFHSLEDEIVTKRFRRWGGADAAPAGFPTAQRSHRLGKLLTKKAVFPSEHEIAVNPSARSAHKKARGQIGRRHRFRLCR